MLRKLVAILSCTCALLCVDCTASTVHRISEVIVSNAQVLADSQELYRHTREDLSDCRNMETDSSNISVWNCSRLYDSSYGYNESSCRFVRENCQTKAHLINYLTFMKCDLPTNLKVSIYTLHYYDTIFYSIAYIACRLHTTNHMVLLPHLSPCYNSKCLVNFRLG